MKVSVPKTMLIVEDDAALRKSLMEVAKIHGYEVQGCDTAKQGFEMAVTLKPALIFCDVHLAQGDGRGVLAKLREDEVMRDCQFVLMTGDWVGASKRTSIEFEADGYLAKPFSMTEFVACADACYRQASL